MIKRADASVFFELAPNVVVGLDSTVSGLVVSALVTAAEHAGASRAALLRAASLAPSTLDYVAARISRAELYRLCEASCEQTHDPAFGLHWAEQLLPRAFNPVTDLVYHAADLRESMRSLDKFHKLRCPRDFIKVVTGLVFIKRLVPLPGIRILERRVRPLPKAPRVILRGTGCQVCRR